MKKYFIYLKKEELNYLKNKPYFVNNFNKKIIKNNKKFLLILIDKEVETLRDFCGEQLQLEGFDENYELTFEGELLENLIDKLYLG